MSVFSAFRAPTFRPGRALDDDNTTYETYGA